MKRSIGFAALVLLMSCQNMEPDSPFTGFETTYELISGSPYNVNGTVSFRERTDGFTTVFIQLSGTAGDAKHPVHLHLGDLSAPKADVAALLNPVVASTGLSETVLTHLADETPVTYKSLTDLSACVKIHQDAAGQGRDVILAGGNIGAAYLSSISNGRSTGITVCKSF